MVADIEAEEHGRGIRRSWSGCSRRSPSSRSGSRTATGRYALLKTYPICRWSGELGPKVKEGDRQAPEGFYTITPGADESELAITISSFNLGFPNAYRPRARPHRRAPDGAWRLLVARLLRDDRRADLRKSTRSAASRSSAASASFQVQAYPFRMTPENFAKHRNNPHIAFWKMLKEGNDHFEVTQHEPKVDVCEKRYVFDAERRDRRGRCTFSAGRQVPGRIKLCPTTSPPRCSDKQRQDDMQIAAAVQRAAPRRADKHRRRRRHAPGVRRRCEAQRSRRCRRHVALFEPLVPAPSRRPCGRRASRDCPTRRVTGKPIAPPPASSQRSDEPPRWHASADAAPVRVASTEPTAPAPRRPSPSRTSSAACSRPAETAQQKNEPGMMDRMAAHDRPAQAPKTKAAPPPPRRSRGALSRRRPRMQRRSRAASRPAGGATPAAAPPARRDPAGAADEAQTAAHAPSSAERGMRRRAGT